MAATCIYLWLTQKKKGKPVSCAMISLNASCFLNKPVVGVPRGLPHSQRKAQAPVHVGALSSNGQSADRKLRWKTMHSLWQYQVPLRRYMAVADLQEMNEKLLDELLIENVEELLPIV